MHIRLPRLTAFADERGTAMEVVGVATCIATVCVAIVASQGPTWIGQTAATAIRDSVQSVGQGTSAQDRAAVAEQRQVEGAALDATDPLDGAAAPSGALAGAPVGYSTGSQDLHVEPFLPPAPSPAPLGAQGASDDQLALPLDRPVVPVPDPARAASDAAQILASLKPAEIGRAIGGGADVGDTLLKVVPSAAGGLTAYAVDAAGTPQPLSDGVAALVQTAASGLLNGGINVDALAQTTVGTLAGSAVKDALNDVLPTTGGQPWPGVGSAAGGLVSGLIAGADLGDLAVDAAIKVGASNLVAVAGGAAPIVGPALGLFTNALTGKGFSPLSTIGSALGGVFGGPLGALGGGLVGGLIEGVLGIGEPSSFTISDKLDVSGDGQPNRIIGLLDGNGIGYNVPISELLAQDHPFQHATYELESFRGKSYQGEFKTYEDCRGSYCNSFGSWETRYFLSAEYEFAPLFPSTGTAGIETTSPHWEGDNDAETWHDDTLQGGIELTEEQYQALTRDLGGASGTIAGDDTRFELLRPYVPSSRGSVQFNQVNASDGVYLRRDLNGDGAPDVLRWFPEIEGFLDGDNRAEPVGLAVPRSSTTPTAPPGPSQTPGSLAAPASGAPAPSTPQPAPSTPPAPAAPPPPPPPPPGPPPGQEFLDEVAAADGPVLASVGYAKPLDPAMPTPDAQRAVEFTSYPGGNVLTSTLVAADLARNPELGDVTDVLLTEGADGAVTIAGLIPQTASSVLRDLYGSGAWVSGDGGYRFQQDGYAISPTATTTAVTTPKGATVRVPGGWVARPGSDGRGLVFQRPGATGAADSVVIRPAPDTGGSVIQYHDRDGRPINPATGQPGTPAETTVPETYRGPLRGWPT